ncbi:phosphodiester glycosidase family protein [Rufibacter radiotolerans]|uniref:phosphodiester glycosidase family protein n=1 Tax=Rufibacter radiotolerans TaxID=1379910 RepID=UPI0009E62EAC|nr:phosphodiester glycosidase family protein [Rufibacter radiotolerans]
MTRKLRSVKSLLGMGALLLFTQPGFAQMTWTKPATLNSGLPASVEVFLSTTPIAAGVPTKAYYTLADLKDPNLELKAAYGGGTSSKTTTQFFTEEQREPAYVAVNGGFFGGNVSYSYLAQSSAVLAPNIKTLNRDLNGTSTPYYPTRGAFGILANNTPDVAWIYSIDASNTTYSYSVPSPNRLGEAPQPVPTATFPAGGALWRPSVGIGGSPVLVQNGAKMITDAEELIVIDNNSRRARTAIGYTADKKMILLVVEGGNPGVSDGATLSEVADIMVSLGAVEALNLDGGGSSTMVVKGATTIRPSDAGVERAMPSSLVLKQRAPEPKIYDTEMTEAFATRNGSWGETGNAGYYGTSKARIMAIGTGDKVARYKFVDLEPGRYELSAWWVNSTNRAKDTPYTVYHDGVAQPSVAMDQSLNGSKFNVVGTYDLRANDSLVVTNLASATPGQATTYVTIDAIRLQKIGTLASSSKDAVLASQVVAYPVPTHGKLYLEVPEALRKNGNVRVMTLVGNTILRKQNLTGKTVELDLTKVPAGVYLVVLESPEGKVVKRIVKQ